MPIERILLEYAKVQLQLIVANEKIVELQAQLAVKTAEPQSEKQ